jgi:DNA-binding SARP family transcriptional activator
MPRSTLPVVERDLLQLYDAAGQLHPLRVGSPAWFAWLAEQQPRAFSYHTPGGIVTLRHERKGGRRYWYAYRRQGQRVRKAYVGKSAELTRERLQAAAVELLGQAGSTRAVGVQLLLLGTPEVRRDGQPQRLRIAKALALLGYLAASVQPQPRDRLMALLWPESSAAAARKNLRNTLWSIRTPLGDVVVEQDGLLALHPTVSSDVGLLLAHAPAAPDAPLSRALEEQALVAALLVQYRGPLLDSLIITGAPEFELWLLETREQLQQRFLRLVGGLMARAQAAQDWSQVLALGERALAVDPLLEEVYRALMTAHVARGEPANALRRYTQLRGALERELGVAPAMATEALRQALIERGGTAPAPEARPRLHALLPLPFIGRVQERRLLDRALAAARAGGAQGVLLAGEPGVGKSRLWQAWSAELGERQALMELRGAASARDIPLGPLRAWFEESPAAQRLLAADGPLSVATVRDLLHQLPELRQLRPELALEIPRPLPQPQGFAALADALLALRGDPPVLFLDDAQWADHTTLAWLGYTLARRRERPLLVVVAYRMQDLDEGRRQLLNAWELDMLAQRVSVPRLSLDEALLLAQALDGDPAIVADVVAQSQGNPYILKELLRARPGEIPASLRARIAACVVDLPAETRQVLEAAALLDPRVTLPLLRRVSGRSERETLDALDRFLRSELVVADDRHYAFAHPLVAAVLRQELNPARRTALLQRGMAPLQHERAS